MFYDKFLTQLIDDAIVAAKKSYTGFRTDKLEGSIAGLEACRNKSPDELLDIYIGLSGYVADVFKNVSENYWWFRCYQAEVEWVCNVVSAALINIGMVSILPHLPTIKGTLKAAQILGVQNLSK